MTDNLLDSNTVNNQKLGDLASQHPVNEGVLLAYGGLPSPQIISTDTISKPGTANHNHERFHGTSNPFHVPAATHPNDATNRSSLQREKQIRDGYTPSTTTDSLNKILFFDSGKEGNEKSESKQVRGADPEQQAEATADGRIDKMGMMPYGRNQDLKEAAHDLLTGDPKDLQKMLAKYKNDPRFFDQLTKALGVNELQNKPGAGSNSADIWIDDHNGHKIGLHIPYDTNQDVTQTGASDVASAAAAIAPVTVDNINKGS